MTACLGGHQLISRDVSLGREVQIYEFVNLWPVQDWRRNVVAKDVPTATVSVSSLMK